MEDVMGVLGDKNTMEWYEYSGTQDESQLKILSSDCSISLFISTVRTAENSKVLPDVERCETMTSAWGCSGEGVARSW